MIEPIKGLDKLFEGIKFKKTKSDVIKLMAGNPLFELDDLILLYHNANPTLRGYMLLSLNLGYTQKEIATMLVGMVDLDKRTISRFREKTDFVVNSQWALWDETHDFLRSNIKPTYPYEYRLDDDGETIHYRYVFSDKWYKREEVGNEAYLSLLKKKMRQDNIEIIPEENIFEKVVYWNDKGTKIDNIASAWTRLRNKLGSKLNNNYSYKSLRKTGSDMIRKVAGLEISQVYLSHTPKTLAEKSYTNPHFEKLAASLELVREQLQPMFDDAPAYGQVYRII